MHAYELQTAQCPDNCCQRRHTFFSVRRNKRAIVINVIRRIVYMYETVIINTNKNPLKVHA